MATAPRADTLSPQTFETMPQAQTASLKVSVVIPCLNEAASVGACVAKAVRTFADLGIVGEVLVVDNGSTDTSREVAREAGARVISCEKKGYGNALRYGFDAARGEYIIMGDADDTYDFTDLERFITALDSGAGLVNGSRFRGRIMPSAMPLLHQIGTPAMTLALNLLHGTHISDCYCGMRAFRRSDVPRMGLTSEGMELTPEMIVRAKRAGLTIVEIPITLYPDHRERKPHLKTLRDGWRGLMTLVRLRIHK